jgi:hypothetical protein
MSRRRMIAAVMFLGLTLAGAEALFVSALGLLSPTAPTITASGNIKPAD